MDGIPETQQALTAGRIHLDIVSLGPRWMPERDFLMNEMEQLYWRTDIVQMTRYFMLEARRCGVGLSPRKAGYVL